MCAWHSNRHLAQAGGPQGRRLDAGAQVRVRDGRREGQGPPGAHPSSGVR